MKEEINRVENRVIHVEKTLKEDINRVETNLKNDIDRLEEHISRMEGKIIKWMSLMVAVAVIIIGVLTYIK